MDRLPTDDELNGGIIGYGVSNIVGAFFGCPPTATYSQNVGIVGSTRVVARKVFTASAVILLIAGLIPKFSALLRTIPQCVLGGAVASVFASIAMTGIKLLVTEKLTYRNTTVAGLGHCYRHGRDAERRMLKSDDTEHPQRSEYEHESGELPVHH